MNLRTWLLDALCAVVLNNTYSNLYLKDHLDELEPSERALATRLFYGTIQNWRLCEYVWQKQLEPGKKADPKVAVLLTMTVYQIIFVKKIPAYAAVNEAVSIARKRFGVPASKFVNGILRNVLRTKVSLPKETLENLSLKYSLPLWLVRLWESQYGLEKTIQMAQSATKASPVYVRRNPLAIDKETFFNDPAIAPGPEGMGIFQGAGIARHPFYKEGKMSVQDEGSYTIAAWVDPKPGESVLDICAAPGTKSMAMAEMMENKGRVDALDLHEHRVKLINSDARRLHLDIVRGQVQDSTHLDGFGYYDKVLCDVPCTGYGILARKPDIKLHLKPEDMDTLVPLQKELLEEASKHVAPGGSLVYSTCTMNKKENDRQIEAFLKSHSDFVLDKMETMFPDQKHDGFFMARVRRKAE
jgi:16S rRNA (cytosine967-C5)-methyltransferase